jgi:anti-sigma factor RsiW
MNNHVTEWLAAYYDGELHGMRRQQVETHLRGCLACRAELEELQKLSQVLLEVPSPERLLSARRFQMQVNLRLPPEVSRPAWQRALKAGWQSIPLAAVLVWVFAQAALLAAGLASVVGLPVGLGFAGWLGGWVSLASFSLSFGGAEAAIELGLLNLAFSALVAVFLCGWIASWWVVRRRSQNDTNLQAV